MEEVKVVIDKDIVNKVIPWAKPALWGREKDYVNSALESLWLSGGEYIDRLENDFAELFNKEHVLAVCNGTAAIHLPYLALGLKPGDEVIVPGFSFMAAANLALQMNLKPVFAEVDPTTWCIKAEAVERLVSPRTRVIVPVHTYGNVCNMDELCALAKKKNLTIIEDCAEALFSKICGAYCGTFGDCGSFSFQATKTITTGEGGLVITDNHDLYRKMLLYRSHGLLERGSYNHVLPGHNFRITNLQAAFGCAQLEKANVIIEKRKGVHEKYCNLLGSQAGWKLQYFRPEVVPVLWAFALKLDPKAFPQGRDTVIKQLKEKGIETRPGFTASSLMKIYEPHSLPVCEDLSRNVISLPSFPSLLDKDIDYICNQLKGLMKK